MGAFQRVLDGACIAIAHVIPALLYGTGWHSSMTATTAIAIVAFNFVGDFTGLYRAWRSEQLIAEVRQVFFAWAPVAAVLLGLAFATKTSATYSRVVSMSWFVCAPLLVASVRLGARLLLRRLRARGRNTRRVAIYGATQTGEELCRTIAERPWLGMRLAGVYDEGSDQPLVIPSAYCAFGGGLDEMVRAAREGDIDIVYIALPLREEARIGEVLRVLADTTATAYLTTDFFTYDLLHARWSMLGRMPVVSVYDSPFHGPAGLLKRAEDLVLGTVIVALIAIPLLVITVVIKLTSRGPVFFRQRRYGLNGKEIRVLKFRTMTVFDDGPIVKQAIKDDPRVTPFGRFLRRTSLDELPQFLQVLTGEMSIVGPRPHAVAHNEEYRALIHGYMLRHKVKPGITGWAQVNGWRGETDDLRKMEKRVEHDLEYIQNWNLFLDLKIIGLTMFGSKKNQNAY